MVLLSVFRGLQRRAKAPARGGDFATDQLQRGALAPRARLGRDHRGHATVKTDLYRLVYYSRNTVMGLEEEVRTTVDQILATSQRNNAAAGVTGALMFTDGLFAQVLEGQQAAIETVFERIQLDDQHSEVRLLSFGPTDVRVFPT